MFSVSGRGRSVFSPVISKNFETTIVRKNKFGKKPPARKILWRYPAASKGPCLFIARVDFDDVVGQ